MYTNRTLPVCVERLKKCQVVFVLQHARQHEDVTRSDRVFVAPRFRDFGIRPRKAAAVNWRSLYANAKSPLQDRRIRGPESLSKAIGEEK
jgi:hypothetical protein